MDDTNAIKPIQYADDITVFLRDVQSLKNLFNLLAQFEEGLNGVNRQPSKTTRQPSKRLIFNCQLSTHRGSSFSV